MPWTVYFKISAKHRFSCSLECSRIWALFSKLQGSVSGQNLNLLELFMQLALDTWRLPPCKGLNTRCLPDTPLWCWCWYWWRGGLVRWAFSPSPVSWTSHDGGGNTTKQLGLGEAAEPTSVFNEADVPVVSYLLYLHGNLITAVLRE